MFKLLAHHCKISIAEVMDFICDDKFVSMYIYIYIFIKLYYYICYI